VLPAEYISLFDTARPRGSRLSTSPTIITDDMQNGGSIGRVAHQKPCRHFCCHDEWPLFPDEVCLTCALRLAFSSSRYINDDHRSVFWGRDCLLFMFVCGCMH